MSETYEFLVSDSKLRLKMKILGDGHGYSLQEFCNETDGFVVAAETCNSPPYSLTLSQIDEIIEARRIALEKVYFWSNWLTMININRQNFEPYL